MQKFDNLKSSVQEIIDLIAAKDYVSSKNKLFETSEALDELLDISDNEDELMEISRYQVLLNQLHRKINGDA